MITVVRCCARNARIAAITVQRRDRLRTSSGTVSGSSARTYFGQMAIARRHYRRRRTRMQPSSAIGGLVIRAGDTVVIRRMYSVPEHITLFGAGAALVAASYPAIMHTGGRGIPCPLRVLTGVPCPFCGLTTAAVALTHGGWGWQPGRARLPVSQRLLLPRRPRSCSRG